MSDSGLRLNSSRSLSRFPRGKSHRTTEDKTTVGLYLPKTLVERAKKNKLNLSKILEEALTSILGYIEAQNIQTNQTESSIFLSRGSFQKESRAGSLARLGHPLDVDISLINWKAFRTWVFNKYAKSHAPTVYCYARKYAFMLNGDFKDLETFSDSKRNSVLKALISLSKFLGVYEQFKARLQNCGVKFARADAFNSFLRIMNNNNEDLLEWFSQAYAVLRDNEKLFLRFALISGLRKTEAINSFNLIIDLAKNGRLSEYYNEDLLCLEHFRFKQFFLRGKKNTYVSFIPKSMVKAIAESEPITYEAIRKRLLRNGLRLRINELRDYFATFMVKHGLIREEVDLLQGRIPPSLFVRSYWSPSLKELRDRTLKAMEKL